MKKLSKIKLVRKKENQYSFNQRCALIGGPDHGEIANHEFGNFLIHKGNTYKISYVLIDKESYPIGIFQSKEEK